MYVSDARREANGKNAALSTGPKTEEGKSASRANALKHGLGSLILIPEDHGHIRDRAGEIYRAFKPYTDYQAWHVDRAAVLTLRIERAERIERRARERLALRAELTWDDDRRLEVETFAGRLAKEPAQAVEGLRRSPQGCHWLIARWSLLAHAADAQDGNAWTPEQTALAFDLLATPAEFRTGRRPGASLDLHGRVLDPADDSAAVARRMVDELIERREVVAGLDEVDRALVLADLDHDSGAESRRRRRYESASHSRPRWAVGPLKFQGPLDGADPGLSPVRRLEAAMERLPLEPKSAEELAIEAADPTKPGPPLCLRPEEYPPLGQKADVVAIAESRKAKRRERARARREAGREAARKPRA